MRGRRWNVFWVCITLILIFCTACRQVPVDITTGAEEAFKESLFAEETSLEEETGSDEETTEPNGTEAPEESREAEEAESVGLKDGEKHEVTETVVGYRAGTIFVWDRDDILQGEDYFIINNREEFHQFGRQAGLDKSLEWALLKEEYLSVWNEGAGLVVIERSDDLYGYEYDVTAKLSEPEGRLTLDVVRYAAEDMVGQAKVTGQLMFIAVPQTELEKVTEICQETTERTYTREELANLWDLGMGDRWLSVQNVDLDHDGNDEALVLYQYRKRYVAIGVLKNGELVWYETSLIIVDGPIDDFYLMQRDGKAYLIKHLSGHYSMSGYHNRYECFHLNENGTVVTDYSDRIYLEDVSYDANQFPFSSDRVQDYVDRLNELLKDSKVLWERLTFYEIYCAPSNVTAEDAVYFVEDMSDLFSEYWGDYSECETIAQKVETYNQYLLNKWFKDGQIPEMSEEFKERMEDRLLQMKYSTETYKELYQKDRSVWFEDYNGEILQFVEPEYAGADLTTYLGKVYYQAEAGETPEMAVKAMINALAEHIGTEMSVDEEISWLSLVNWSDQVEKYTNLCWSEYMRYGRHTTKNPLAYAEKWTPYQYGLIPLEEEMWYFHPYGNTGSESGSEYLVVKQGNLYCMQRGEHWGDVLYEENDYVVYPDAENVNINGVVYTKVIGVYRADLDHDGEKEHVVVQEAADDKGSQILVIDHHEIVWNRWSSLVSGCTGMFLCSEGGKDYLVAYCVEGKKGDYRYLQFSLVPNEKGDSGQQKMKEEPKSYDWLIINRQDYTAYPLDSEPIIAYLDRVNEMLSGSLLICWDNGTQAAEKTEAVIGGYVEDLSEMFVPADQFADCRTIEEKVERLTQIKMESWFPNGQIPKEIESLSETIVQRMGNYIGEPEDDYVKIDETRGKWFGNYNGEKMQVIEVVNNETTSKVFFYRAGAGETAADVAEKLLGTKTLRNYSTSEDDPAVDILEEYCQMNKKAELTTTEKLEKWITRWLNMWYGEKGSKKIYILPKDMWIVVSERYEDTAGVIPFMEDASQYPEEVYLLVKYGNVYRLQKASEWRE